MKVKFPPRRANKLLCVSASCSSLPPQLDVSSAMFQIHPEMGTLRGEIMFIFGTVCYWMILIRVKEGWLCEKYCGTSGRLSLSRLRWGFWWVWGRGWLLIQRRVTTGLQNFDGKTHGVADQTQQLVVSSEHWAGTAGAEERLYVQAPGRWLGGLCWFGFATVS